MNYFIILLRNMHITLSKSGARKEETTKAKEASF
jgi:hypothetical protein